MKYPVYSYRDVKVGFLPPQCDQSDQSAIRGFAYAVNQPGLMQFSPKDFDLFKVGEFDTDSGELIPCLPVQIASGASVYNGDDK